MELYFVALLLIIFILIIINLLIKNEKYEDIIENQNKLLVNQNNTLNSIYESIVKAKETVNELDEKGILQSDDEIGTFFNYMKDIQNLLEMYFKNLENGKN